MLIRDTNTLEDLDLLLKDDANPIFLYFYAPWCTMCQTYVFKIEQFSNKYPHIKVIKIDVSKAQIISDYYKVLSVPSVIVIKNEEVFHRFSHIQPIRELEKLL